VPHWQIRPYRRNEGEPIAGYLYRANGREYELATEDVVHFRFGLDDTQLLGISRLYPVLREVVSDNALSTYLCALLRNMGIPGVLITPADKDGYIPDEEARLLQEEWAERYAGERTG